jgi:hypothetical protein
VQGQQGVYPIRTTDASSVPARRKIVDFRVVEWTTRAVQFVAGCDTCGKSVPSKVLDTAHHDVARRALDAYLCHVDPIVLLERVLP